MKTKNHCYTGICFENPESMTRFDAASYLKLLKADYRGSRHPLSRKKYENGLTRVYLWKSAIDEKIHHLTVQV